MYTCTFGSIPSMFAWYKNSNYTCITPPSLVYPYYEISHLPLVSSYYTVLPKNLVRKPRRYKKLERYPMVYPSTTFHNYSMHCTFFTTYTLDTRTTCFTVSSSFLVDDRKYKKVCYCSHVMHLTLNT